MGPAGTLSCSIAPAAISFRSKCGSVHELLERHKQHSPGGTPHAGQATEVSCLNVRSPILIRPYCTQGLLKNCSIGDTLGISTGSIAPTFDLRAKTLYVLLPRYIKVVDFLFLAVDFLLRSLFFSEFRGFDNRRLGQRVHPF
jgi:hypothetical protein